jgi:tetratricopeptide (TPR) repeat protein
VPHVKGLSFQRLGQSSNTSIINGRVSRQESLTYGVRATERTKLGIPAFVADTDKGKVTVAAVSFDVGDATVGQNAVALDTVANSRFTVPTDVWAGEVFPVTYSANIARRYFYQVGGGLEWNSTPLSLEEWGKPELFETASNGESRVLYSQKTRGYVKSPGNVILNPGTQLMNLTTGSSNFGFFSRPTVEQYSIPTNRPTINVKPLPANAPADYSGGVGQFKLESKVVPASAAVGEPVTWTLSLSGTGNWPDINGLPSRNVSKDFRVVQPQAKRTPKEGSLFDATLTEDVVLIPAKAGTYQLGPVTWSYFDPSKGSYQTITAERTSLTVEAPAPTPATAAPDVGNPNASATQRNDAARGTPPVAPPDTPGAIPRDPLTGTAHALTPFRLRSVLLWSGVPLLALIVYWFSLAFRRAKITDSVRPQREARDRLIATVAQLRSTKDAEKTNRLLRAWQQDTATLWQLPRAVPSATDFASDHSSIGTSAAVGVVPATPALKRDAMTEAWKQLWIEADRALYGAEAALPADWATRADKALGEKTVKAFSGLQLFRSENLIPLIALALICLGFGPQSMHAQEARAAYDKGDFPAAEKAWRQTLSQNPTDWIAHHNLSLALAQQDQWPEAAAHAAVAFAQHPRNPAVRWNFELTSGHAGYIPSALGNFVRPSPLHLAARTFSPAEWQALIFVGLSLLAFAGALFLTKAYGADSTLLRPAGWVLVAIGGVAIIGSVVGLRLYSPADDIRAALIWRNSTLRSVPTEADTTQKTTPLAPGTIASVNKNFLGWVQLVFSNGQTGWVRKDDLVRIWQKD